jgi:hypothetical protein
MSQDYAGNTHRTRACCPRLRAGLLGPIALTIARLSIE